MNETWRPVVGYEGSYEVSDCGRVRGVTRRDAQGRMWPGRVLKQKTHRFGHVMVDLCRGAARQRHFVHVLVLEAFDRPRPEGLLGLHNDGDPTNNHATNLRWGTQSDNQYDAVRHGTHRETRKVVCPRGHLLEPPNLAAAAAKRGHRNCLACQRGRSAAKHHGLDLAVAADQKYLELMGAKK